MCSDEVKQAKVQLELNLSRDTKNNTMGFYRYVSQKRKVKESTPLLMSNAGKQEKAEILNKFLPQSSLATSLPTPLEWMDHKTGTGGAKSLPL